uniref:RNI-like protein n=1 Tax=Aureoumbra lagunensis TaxID=44058 RepID=A0A7S3JR43_9STRA
MKNSIEVVIENQPWVLRVSLPRGWLRDAFVNDLIQIVIKKREAILACLHRRGYVQPWLPDRCAEVRIVDAPLKRMRLVTWLADKKCIEIVKRSEWRCPQGIPPWLPGDGIKEILHYAGGNMSIYRCLCRRFRDEASDLIRRVTIDGSQMFWWAHCQKAFPRAEIVIFNPCNHHHIAIPSPRKEALAALRSWTNLSVLNISNNGALTSQGLATQILNELPAVAPRLRALDISECYLDNHEETIASLAQLSQLRALDISDCTGISAHNIHESPFFDKLYDLALSGTSAWEQVSLNTSRRIFALSRSRFFDLSSFIIKNPALRSLRLVDCGLNDRDLVALRSLHQLDSDLDLSQNPHISDLGIRLLFHSGHSHPEPVSLSLRSCDQLTDTALEMLAARNWGLQDLDLELCWRLSAQGIRILARNITSLRHLYLRGAASVLRKAVRDDLIDMHRDSTRQLLVHFGPRFQNSRDARRGNRSPLAHWFKLDATLPTSFAVDQHHQASPSRIQRRAPQIDPLPFHRSNNNNNDDDSNSSTSTDDGGDETAAMIGDWNNTEDEVETVTTRMSTTQAVP